MEKKKGFQMPHTYIIIFGVILFAALLTVFIPLGKYDTKEITYMQNGVEKTRTVLDPESFQYILDENGKPYEVLSVGMDSGVNVEEMLNKTSLLIEGNFVSSKLFI